jgi:hypothetical protein
VRKSSRRKNRILQEAYSRPLGAVRLRENFLKNDPPLPRQLHQMQVYIQEKLEGAVRRLGAANGTARSPPPPLPRAVAAAISRTPRDQRDSIDRMRVTNRPGPPVIHQARGPQPGGAAQACPASVPAAP